MIALDGGTINTQDSVIGRCLTLAKATLTAIAESGDHTEAVLARGRLSAVEALERESVGVTTSLSKKRLRCLACAVAALEAIAEHGDPVLRPFVLKDVALIENLLGEYAPPARYAGVDLRAALKAERERIKP